MVIIEFLHLFIFKLHFCPVGAIVTDVRIDIRDHRLVLRIMDSVKDDIVLDISFRCRKGRTVLHRCSRHTEKAKVIFKLQP